MILEGTIHCEGPDCNAHAHVGADTMEHGRLPVGWLRLVEHGGSADYERAFCGYDCCMKWCAQLPPPTVIPVEQQPEGDEGG